ncbi:MAG: tRNA (adenosine(37)-N6)-threonylcarbamoyltransferase complex ATPase subunit type 1 TsaE [Clostridia bacterium]|nr:tRNA (adenosine(37)-N6)-threonylcarbamoyltransferase complex ATPase subunit type 1 TsaE [Clostridia bacterium]
MAEYLTHGPAETEALAASLAAKAPAGAVIALFGDLGAGKTAFARGYVRGRGIEAEVSSPTFALVNEYGAGNQKLYHFDMYRISGWEDLYSTGFFDYLDTGAQLLIEWSENIEAALPPDCIRITIEKTPDPLARRITVIGAD